jgi:hypothetical protein
VPASATDEEVAAVLAVLFGPRGDRPDDGYRLWRATRLKALREKDLRASESQREQVPRAAHVGRHGGLGLGR